MKPLKGVIRANLLSHGCNQERDITSISAFWNVAISETHFIFCGLFHYGILGNCDDVDNGDDYDDDDGHEGDDEDEDDRGVQRLLTSLSRVTMTGGTSCRHLHRDDDEEDYDQDDDADDNDQDKDDDDADDHHEDDQDDDQDYHQNDQNHDFFHWASP